MFENSVDVGGTAQRSFTATGGGQSDSPLAPGVYDVWAESDIHIKTHKTLASDVTATTGYLINVGNVIPVRITSPSYLGAIGAGDVFFHKVG